MGCDRDSLSVITSSTQMEGLYARDTGMYARKKAVTATANDIVLSTEWFYVRRAANRHSNAFFNDVGVELKFRTQIQKSERLSGFSPTENTKRIDNGTHERPRQNLRRSYIEKS